LGAARDRLIAARRICFLGFGYQNVNVNRLAIGVSHGTKRIFGTCRGLIGMEVDQKEQLLWQAFGSSVHLAAADNLELLREHLILG
jgi:hypothetical protein